MWGNPRLVQWDYGKEINITLEDALLSLESLRFMLGGAIKQAETNKPVYIRHSEEVTAIEGGKVPKPKHHLTKKELTPVALDEDHPIRVINLTKGVRTQITSGTIDGTKAISFHNDAMLDADVTSAKGDRIRIFWYEKVEQANKDAAVEITISPSTFPGTYRVIGDTFMRNTKGKDEAFQFIINKAKVVSEVTITLEAEGDPSTFEMTLNALRDTNEDGEQEMMKLVRYSTEDADGEDEGDDIGSLVTSGGSDNP